MKIGIIGYGKMGKDIFSLLFDKLSDAQFVVIVRSNVQQHTESVMKTLGKSLKRKKISEELYNFKKDSFLFSDDISALSGCDIVTEAISEDAALKKDIFAKAANVVSDSCLLLTNTSSLDIASVFEDIPNKERCFGLHFFYPVKLTGFVELNILPETSESCMEKAEQLVRAAGKTPIVFSGTYHIYLNQILACMVAHAIYLRESFDVTVSELNDAMSELFSIAGPFDILDSVSLGLMAGDPENFRIERNKELLGYGFREMNKWIDAGCPKETLSFLDFMSEHESASGNPCDKAPLYMAAMILNEIVNSSYEYNGDKAVFLAAVQDTLGISESPAYYYRKYGAKTLLNALDELYLKTHFNSYLHHDKDVWDNSLA